MEVSTEDKKEFFRRKKILEEAKEQLKKEFVGLNDVVDEVIDLIEAWYLFPAGQIRPTIVNLWGMTGVGKTSLIKKLFELINLKDSLYKFDVGDYASQDNTKLSYSFSEELKNVEKQQIGLIFDEFQLGRTIDENGSELEKSGLRAMWELLDSGKISILQASYHGTKVYQLILRLEDCVKGGVESKNGTITKKKEYHDRYFKSDEDDVNLERKNNKFEEELDLFVPEEFYWNIQTIWEQRFITERELKEFLNTMDHVTSIEFLIDTLNKALKPMEFDYSTSCIFIIGNIDEAYRMTNDFDPDSDADRFYKNSIKITLPQIKSALHKRFRAEQIARLGNSHIIYPAFSSKVYRELISLEIIKITDKIRDRFGLELIFDKSINEIIYKEGVFPSQGARPVFTTINSLIESYVGKAIKDIFESGEDVESINWKFFNKKHIFKFFNKDKREVLRKSYKVRLKVENLRQSEGSELQAQVAIHEAGHVVAAIYGANIIPSEVVSRSASMSEGYCSVEIPSTGMQTREELEKHILLSLGGYVAEMLVFGENRISNGTSTDFERATSIALHMAKSFGMVGRAPMLYGHKSANTNHNWSSYQVDDMDDLAEKIISKAEADCVKIISDNKLLLLKIGDYLSNNSRMNKKKIQEFVNEYGNPIEIKDNDNYHNFKSTIVDKLAEEESGFRSKINAASRVGTKLK